VLTFVLVVVVLLLVVSVGLIATLVRILLFLGICRIDNVHYLCSEYLPIGNLVDFLQQKPIPPDSLIEMALTGAEGMIYLSSKGIIHRDLAARNILVQFVNNRNILKITDFGLSRFQRQLMDASNSFELVVLPFRSTSPEGLLQQFVPKSDCWAFGVVLWEMFEIGGIPFPDFHGTALEDMYEYLKQGNRPRRPPTCPASVYTLMEKCWLWNADERPSFCDIYKQLAEALVLIKNNTKNDATRERPGEYDAPKTTPPTGKY